MERKLKPNPKQFENIYSRAAKAITINESDRIATLVAATEQPVIVFDWANWEPVREIILMDGLKIPDDGVRLLDTHSRFSTEDIKGSVRDFKLERNFEDLGSVYLANAYFSSTAEKEWTLYEEGHLTDSSIGYRVYEDKTIVLAPGQKKEIDGRTFENNYGDNLPLYIRLETDLLEVSLVPIGADQAAKFRSMFGNRNNSQEPTDKHNGIKIEDLRNLIKEELNERENKIIIINNERADKMADTKEKDVKAGEERDAMDEQRRADIETLADQFKDKVKGVDLEQVKNLFITGGKSAKEFSELILEKMEETTSVNKPNANFGLSEEDKKSFSLSRLILSYDPNVKIDASHERSIVEEYTKKRGAANDGGIVIPPDVLPLTSKRDLQVSGSAGNLVATNLLAGEFIEYPRNLTVVERMGARVLDGLVGDIAIPVQTGDPSGSWVAEDGSASESDPTFAQRSASPKTYTANTAFSRKLLLQSTPSVDSLVNDSLRNVALIATDLGALHGTGASNQPEGITSNANVNTVDASSFTWKTAQLYKKAIATNNLATPRMGFVTNATIEAELKARPKESGQPIYILSENNMMAGYPVEFSEQVAANNILFGDWSQLIVCRWAGLELLVDPYTQSKKGQVIVTVFVSMDVVIAQPSAFAISTNFS